MDILNNINYQISLEFLIFQMKTPLKCHAFREIWSFILFKMSLNCLEIVYLMTLLIFHKYPSITNLSYWSEELLNREKISGS